ncbi:BTAD domain-containing putative transcriptional regulator [Aminobacter sp. BE322]|uniref:BTAD domain-containing putative transcriptional regulator n=1 Tax=unclassified Aminobacter TaxID=2644704 RepID=UPI003D1A4863
MRIRLFGGLEVVSPENRPVRFATRKTAQIFAALVLAGGKPVRREALCEAFWPGRGEAQARNSLRQALVDIRRSFPAGNAARVEVESDLDTVTLKAEPGTADIWVFEQTAQGDDGGLATAAELYRGDLLAADAIHEGTDWFAPHQRSYRRIALQVAERLSQAAPRPGSPSAAACERLAERLLAADPTAEEAHRAIIRLCLQRGQPNAALRQYKLCQEALRRELEAEPEAATSALIEAEREVSPPPGQNSTSPVPDRQSPSRGTDQPSVVVLPFENLSGPEDEFLVEGVVEEITATLSRVSDFFVIARQSAYTYRGRFVDLAEIGRELGVQYAVEGSVRRSMDRVRVAVKLEDTRTRAQIWSERYDRAASDIFALQDEIAGQVAGAMHPALLKAEIEAARRKPPESLRAYELVLRAYPDIWSATSDGNRLGIALLEQAIAADQRYGRAYALRAWGHAQNLVYLWSSDPDRERQLALADAETAARLASNDPMALTAMGAALSMCTTDQSRAGAYIERALALDPNSAWAWARSGWVAIYRDQPQAARRDFERAMALSPFDPLEHNFTMGLAAASGLEGKFAQAAKLTQDMIDKNPQVTWAYRQLAAYSVFAGDPEAARRAIATLRAANPGVSIAVMKKSHPFRHIPRLFDTFVEGWRRAGLPEE